jgi:LPS-assembly protein
MGRRIGPVEPKTAGLRPRLLALAATLAAGLAFALLSPAAFAQTARDEAAAEPQRMVVEAAELIQNDRDNTVTARGNVQIYYKGRILEADRVVYDRKTSRVYAEGHAKLTEANGEVAYAERFDLTDDLKNGFIDSLRAESKEKTYLSSPRAEYTGNDRVYDRTTYTACAPCDEHPEQAPLWRIRARRVIQKTDEQNLYFEDADLELFGMPIAYLPFFSMPDPTVKRRAGLLSPRTIFSSQLGYGVGIPIYWDIQPNMDLTFTPTPLTKQGVLLEMEFRHRLENGTWGVRVDGIRQLDRGAFAIPPFGAQDRKVRGSVASTGEFAINERWKWGWDGAWQSDRYFLQDYKLYDPLYNNLTFREISSTAYLTGKGEQSWFDLRGFSFQGLSPRDYQPQIGFVAPLLEFNRVFPVSPQMSLGLGGQVELDVNAMYNHAQAALFDPIQPRSLDSLLAANYVCQFYTPGLTPQASQCLMRGIGGDYARATAQASWKRQYIDPLGEVWTPFAFVRGTGTYLNYDTGRVYSIYNSFYQPLANAAQSAFLGSDDVARANVTPGIGLEYRYPFFSKTPYGSLTVEPIAQIIARPDRGLGSNSLVNIDSQSLVFDDSSLFDWNKYSGYDRFETGTRLNYGGQATLNFANGGFLNFMGGQSFQLAGRNGYAVPDAANVGVSSGLDTRRSDYVGRFAFAPNAVFSFVAKGRFDVNTFAPRRVDLIAGMTFGALVLNAQYANYSSQPLIGFDVRRQGLSVGGRYDITSNYYVAGRVTFDLSRHEYNNNQLGLPAYFYNSITGQSIVLPQNAIYGSAPLFSIANLAVGAGYHDDCTTLSVNYSMVYQPNSVGQPARNQTVLVSLQLRTLGQASFGASLGTSLLNDGLKQLP